MTNPTPPTPPKPPGSSRRAAQGQIAHKPTARKAGHNVDTPGENAEEHIPEAEAHRLAERLRAEQIQKTKKPQETKKARPNQREDSETRDRREKQKRQGDQSDSDPRPGSESEDAAPKGPATKAGLLAHNAAFAKSSADIARARGFQQTPGLAEIIAGKAAPKTGESLGELLPGSRMRSHPDLPEPDMRPPLFLSPLESMTDIYMRTRGRMTNRTKELLGSTELEDLLAMIAKLFESEELQRKSEARLLHPIWSKLKDDPGPLLLGLADPRLTELWRLLLDRWDIWVPDDSEEHGGVELFWEGEAEDDDGAPIEILQTLTFQEGELTLYAKLGSLEDRVTFDGEAFYRLKTQRTAPKPRES